jgi:hypothetical protein
MSDDLRRLTTEEQREQIHGARRRGGVCAACGRALSADEPVYIERFAVRGSWMTAPVGVECASPELLQQVAGQEPEHCAGCGRGVYYRSTRSIRHQALCCRACGARVQAAKRSKAEGLVR